MPSIAEVISPSPTGTKRKREQTHVEADLHTNLTDFPQQDTFSDIFSNQSAHYERHLLKPRLLKSSRGNDQKRQRIILEEYHEQQHPHSNFQSRNSTLFRSYSAPNILHGAASATKTNEVGSRGLDLRPCHICHRKPTVKSDLDSYATCEACDSRTCYVCIRECLGPATSVETIMQRFDQDSNGHGKHDDHETMGNDATYDGMSFEFHNTMDENSTCHDNEHDTEHGTDAGEPKKKEDSNSMLSHHRMICSRCCVERGADGEVRCFGCLRAGGEG